MSNKLVAAASSAASDKTRIRVSGRLAGAFVLLLAGLGVFSTARAPAAFANCLSPNVYAYGADNTGNRYGISGNIDSYNDLNNSYNNENFTDDAEHQYLVSGKGLEVGWFEGWGNQIQAYVTDAHAYATANGPREVDGPEINNANDFYIAYWSGNGNEHYGVRNNGNVIFEGTISTDGYNGPGNSYAIGEVAQSGTVMQGYFTNLQHEYGFNSGNWFNWPGMSTCADHGYSATEITPNTFEDLTN